MLEIYTDGCCIGNPGKGGYAAVLNGKEIGGGCVGETTNNRMEIMGIVAALDYLFLERPNGCTIYSDSKYAIGVISGSYKAKSNLDLVSLAKQKLDNVKTIGTIVNFEWVRGHSGVYGNEMADRFSERWALKAKKVTGVSNPWNQNLEAQYSFLQDTNPKRW